MRRKQELVLVRGGNRSQPVSAASTDEQARYLCLADIALGNKPQHQMTPLGDLAKQDHQKLTQEIIETVAKFKRDAKDVA